MGSLVGRLPRTGLRVRIVLVILLAAMPATAMLGHSYVDTRRMAAEQVMDGALRLARLTAFENQRLVEGTRDLLFALANKVRDQGAGACRSFFSDLRRRYPYYANVGVIDPDGLLVCSGVPTKATVNVSDRRYFRRAIETLDFAAGEYQIGRVTGKATVNFGYPLADERGQVSAVVFAALDLDRLTQAAQVAQMPPGSTVTVFDRNGTILARYPGADEWIGVSAPEVPTIRRAIEQGEGVATHRGLDGVPRLYGFATLSRMPEVGELFVSVGIPTAVAFAGVNRVATRNLAGLVVIVMLSLGAAWFGGDVMVLRPVRALVAATMRMRAGDLSARTGFKAGGDEIGVLTGAFDEMAEALEQHDTQLRQTEARLRQVLGDAQRRLQRLHALRAVDLAITGTLDIRATLNVLVSKVTNELHVHAADVLLLDPRSQTLECVASRGFRSPILQRPRVPLGEGHAGRAALERVPVRIPDLAAATDPYADDAVVKSEGFVAYSAVPLIAQGQVKGVLELFHRAPLEPDPEWPEFLDTLAGQAAIAINNALLFDGLQRANDDLALAYDATLEGWSHALDLRDKETEGHTLRVTETTLRLARELGMDAESLVHIRRGALLHDIGKMGIPDRILTKPAPLTSDEWAIMRKHPVYAFELLSPIAHLRPALDIPYAHHEKWDGSGYPRGLKGEEIPFAARIFAVVDAWDALRSDRPYRPSWLEDRVLAHLRERAGKDFDPVVVEAFLRLLKGDAGAPARAVRATQAAERDR